MITKNIFQNIMRCPKWWYLNKFNPSAAGDSCAPEVAALFCEELRKEFPDRITIINSTPDVMVSSTNLAIDNGAKYVAEASFLYDDCFTSINMFQIEDEVNKTCRIYDLKANSEPSTEDIKGLAYQAYIVEKSGWDITQAIIVNINTEYVNDGSYDRSKVFIHTDVTPEIKGMLLDRSVEEAITKVKEQVETTTEKTPFPVCLSANCKAGGNDCPFIAHCIGETKADVFKIGGIRFTTKLKMYNNCVTSFDDVIGYAANPKNKVSNSALVQARAHSSGTDIISHQKDVREMLCGFKFPLYFLDFESFQMGMPEWNNTSAYQQIPFQYSLHKMSKNGKISHKEFLADGKSDPRRVLAEALIRDCKKRGTILSYNASFEKSRIRELASTFPDLKEKLLKIESRIDDLMIPFSKRWIYLTAQEGSYSIKHVLPALYPNDSSLDYSKLEGVHNGAEAAEAYRKLAVLDKEEREILRDNLLRYCELDTWALVLVYKWLLKTVL